MKQQYMKLYAYILRGTWSVAAGVTAGVARVHGSIGTSNTLPQPSKAVLMHANENYSS